MIVNISTIWEELEQESQNSDNLYSRTYRLLGNTAQGIRASYIPQDHIMELLIEIPEKWRDEKSLPNWRGMHFEIIDLRLYPRSEMMQLRLFLDDSSHKAIFITFCEDLVSELENVDEVNVRVQRIEDTLARWNRFFDKCGPLGLKPAAQRGLFGELLWLQRLLTTDISNTRAISSWKGCERNYHDFDLNGAVLEVKTTLSKEPRYIRINNERQLDDRGIKSLHLYVATLHALDGEGLSLPEIVCDLRNVLSESPSARSIFERALISSGYHRRHEQSYTTNYIIKKEELFTVSDEFPRIIDIPQGTGKLRYNVVLSACKIYLTDLEEYFLNLTGEING